VSAVSYNLALWPGWEVRVLGDGKVGDAVSLLAPAGVSSDSFAGSGPTDAEVALAAGVARVRFFDAGDHPSRLETINTIEEVQPTIPVDPCRTYRQSP